MYIKIKRIISQVALNIYKKLSKIEKIFNPIKGISTKVEAEFLWNISSFLDLKKINCIWSKPKNNFRKKIDSLF